LQSDDQRGKKKTHTHTHTQRKTYKAVKLYNLNIIINYYYFIIIMNFRIMCLFITCFRGVIS
jgi:hypothetical protein